MGRRGARAPRKQRTGPSHNEANRRSRESRQKTRMLDDGVEHKFRYYAEEWFREAGIAPEVWRPFLQTVWARGSRNGIDEARDYVRNVVKEGTMDEETGKRLLRLIDQYSIVR